MPSRISPANPCKALKATSTAMDGAKMQMMLEARKATEETRKTALRPKRSEAGPQTRAATPTMNI
jgi:hypothetical protein